jgi:hypothetical protein
VLHRLDQELARHLRPVAAPEGLWFHIQEPHRGAGTPACQVEAHLDPVFKSTERRHECRRGSLRGCATKWRMWAFAAAVAATIALFCFSLRSDTGSYLAKFAAGELARGVEDVQFRSADPKQIRAWVQANAGIDIPLPARAGESVKLIGVSVFRNGSPMVCVTYRVGNQPSRLLVTRATNAVPQHGSMERSSYHGNSISTWVMQGQAYMLAGSGCVLCHVKT